MQKKIKKSGPIFFKNKLFIFDNDDEQPTWMVRLNSIDHALAYYMRDRARSMIERDQVKMWLEEHAGGFGSALTVMTDVVGLRYNMLGRSLDKELDVIYTEYLFNSQSVATQFELAWRSQGHRVKLTRDQVADPAIFTEIRKTLPFDVDEWTLHYGDKRGYELVLRDPRVATMVKLAWTNVG